MDEAASKVERARSTLRDPAYRKLLVLSAVVGLVVSIAAWAFLTLVPLLQDFLYLDLPDALGFSEAPWWWPLPVLLVAGVVTAFAIRFMRGGGGGVPAEGMMSGGTPDPRALPSVLLAGIATLGFGLVLGPSSPVITLGLGIGLIVIGLAASDAPEHVRGVVAAAGGFAALAVTFNNPIIAAIVVVEAIGIGGAMAPVIVLPGLISAGIGSLVFYGVGNFTGLSTDAYALVPLQLDDLGSLTVSELLWAVPLGILCGALGVAVLALAMRTNLLIRDRVLVWVPIMGVLVAVCVILYEEITGETGLAILFSGSRALNPVVEEAGTLGAATLAWLLLFKAVAWTLSLGSFRGGPVFPAIFVGTAAGLLASELLPALSLSAALPITVAATLVAVLRLPLSAAVITLLFTGSAGLQSAPLIITGLVIAFVTAEVLRDRFVPSPPEPAEPEEGSGPDDPGQGPAGRLEQSPV